MILSEHRDTLRAAMPPRGRRLSLDELAARLQSIKLRCQSRLSHRDERQLLFEAKRIVHELEQIPEQQPAPAIVPVVGGQSTRHLEGKLVT